MTEHLTGRPMAPRDLGGGLELRTIGPDDIDETADLLEARGEPADAEDLRLVLDDPEGGRLGTAVVVDGARVVATATLLDERLVLGGYDIPAGQVELVATATSHEGRGLARALMHWCHERSTQRGHLAQVMIGIPNFYRRFGYSYALPMPRGHQLSEAVTAPESLVVRRASARDIPAMAALQDAEQAAAGLQMPHSPACWRWLVARSGSEQWVAERKGKLVAVGRLVPEEVALGEVAATEADGAVALLAHAASLVGDGALTVQPRGQGVAHDALVPFLDQGGAQEWYYARIADLAGLISHLGPLLGSRFESAGLDDGEADNARNRVLLSTYDRHIAFDIAPQGVSNLSVGGRMQAPVSRGGSGLAAESVPGLLFGPYGAIGLEEREPDCWLGRQRELMSALFPPVTADLLTFYLPI